MGNEKDDKVKITDEEIEEFAESVDGHLIIDPNDVPDEDWTYIRARARKIMPTVKGSVYRAAVLAYFEYLGYLENATRH